MDRTLIRQELNSKIASKGYTTLESLYNDVIATIDGNQSMYCTVSGSAISDLTAGYASRVCRVYIMKADASTLDYFLYIVTDKTLYTGRITSGPNVIYVSRYIGQ